MTLSQDTAQSLKLMRPKQWVKNLFVLAPLFFSFQFFYPESWVPAVIAVCCFIQLSAAVYIINDWKDREEDRAHPRKKLRPLAAGTIPVKKALATAAFLLLFAYAAAFLTLPLRCLGIMTGYLLLQCLYSFYLKRQAIADVLVIALGFVLRVLMGAAAIAVPVSPWIILTTYLLALFLGFGKRYHELTVQGYDRRRASLRGYNRPLLDRMISISCGTVLLSYALYTVETARELDRTELVYTVAFVIFGLFRYLQTIYVHKGSGEPELALLKDKVFLVNGLAWFVTTLFVLM